MTTTSSMRVLVLVTLLLTVFLSGHAQKLGNCDPIGAVTQSEVDSLTDGMSAETFSKAKIDILTNFVTDLDRGFGSNETVQILKTLSFSSDMTKAIELMSKNILGLTSQSCYDIITTFQFSSDRLNILKVVANFAVDLKKNSEVIIEAFSGKLDQDKARQILRDARPRSCLWGDITLDRFDFIVDVSGSMGQTFRTNDGVTLSRLSFVKNELLRVMNSTLEKKQKFNIIKFSSDASAWQPGVQPVTPENIQSASDYVQLLKSGGATYVLKALELSFTDDDVNGVYLLSDGEPDGSSAAIIDSAVAWGKPVNTIAFKAGRPGTDFLQRLAQATKGTFRAFK